MPVAVLHKILTLDYFIENDYEKIPSQGPLPVSVPGCVDCWFEMHDKFGNLPMTELLAPSIKYAREGFPLTELISYYLNLSIPFYDRMKSANINQTYLSQNGGNLPNEGELAQIISEFIKDQGGF